MKRTTTTRPLLSRGWGRNVLRWALWGPLLGGLPYNVFLLPIPLAYMLGVVPAALGGLLYALWWGLPTRRRPDWRWRGAAGLLCAGLACLLCGLTPPGTGLLGVWLLQGLPAGLALALTQPADDAPPATCP